ncbi:MAG: energy-coupling factor ABC transporter permease [Gammaproteobacteria bacterium]|nr:energy-coupling factor ABC transporter permease [Gammaproteobacteria bacterium]MBU1601196.1 energy-coupling factor ABC transporter permease [Gammaproteobacteria bacterium]MBU2434815.1 energy-coupling factor ABC transporter permease [Gammaproteobacteria bacterium]MBU2450543.1 energy-coupling factor ABC transporter permease [Gammaproteobacteria bacterium]
MNLTDTLMGEGWYWAAWIAWVLFFAHSLWRAPWVRLKDSEQLNVWLGMIVLLTVVWSLKAGVKPGLSFHLLGATVFTLSFGPHLAFVGLSLVTLGITLNGAAGPIAYAANALLLAGLSVGLSQLFCRFVSAALPRHFFVYIFVNGFLGAALTIIGVGFAATCLLAMVGAYEWDYLISEYFPYFLLLAFSEAWLSGMMMTLFVVYRPEWVVSFNDSSYLVDK